MTQYVTFTLGGALYGVEVKRVQEALRAHTRTRVPLAPVDVAGLVNLRGQVVLTVDLRPRLGRAPLAADAEPMMVVVQVDGEPLSLLVDEIGDVVEVGPDLFESPPETLALSMRSLIQGSYKLESALLLILDVDQVTAA